MIVSVCDQNIMIEDKLLIEFAKYSDASEIGMISKNDIEYDLGWYYTPERISRLINSKLRNVVVARVNNELAGFGIMTYHADQANLDLLAVKHNYRRLKIGSHIVIWLEKVALTGGAFNIFIQVREINRGAIEFYKTLGFITLDKEKHYYRGKEAGIIMSKSLRPMFNTT